jgi:hypothetical protein
LGQLNRFYERNPFGYNPFSGPNDVFDPFSGNNTEGTGPNDFEDEYADEPYDANPVLPIDPVGDLPEPTDGLREAEDVEVRTPTKYALQGAVPTQPVESVNPFARPESQEGIGSLAGGG